MHHNYDSDWLSNSYHTVSITPMWIGVEVNIVKPALPNKHIKFDEYVQTPEDKLECIEKFNTVWNNDSPKYS